MWSGEAESSSRPASGGLPPIGAAVASHLAPAALPRLPAVFLVPMIFSSPIREGLSPARSQPPPPACCSLASLAGGGSFGSVLAMVGTEPVAPRPGRSSASHSDPGLRAQRPPTAACAAAGILPPTPCSWSAPGHRDHTLLGPRSSLHHVLEVRGYKRFCAPITQPPDMDKQPLTLPPTFRMLAVLDPSCVPLFHMTAARERWGSDWSVGLKSPSVLDSATGATASDWWCKSESKTRCQGPPERYHGWALVLSSAIRVTQ